MYGELTVEPHLSPLAPLVDGSAESGLGRGSKTRRKRKYSIPTPDYRLAFVAHVNGILSDFEFTGGASHSPT
jgi:hypothetical protein